MLGENGMEHTVQELHAQMQAILAHAAEATDEEAAELVVQEFVKNVTRLGGILYDHLSRLQNVQAINASFVPVESRNLQDLLDRITNNS